MGCAFSSRRQPRHAGHGDGSGRQVKHELTNSDKSMESSGRSTVAPSDMAMNRMRRRSAYDTFTYVRRLTPAPSGHVRPDQDPLEVIVGRYQATGKLSSQDVQQLFRSTFQFPRSESTFKTVCRIMLHRGEPLLACDILATATRKYPHNGQLRQLHGLALAQAGCTHRAMGVLEGLRAGGDTSEETSGVLARCYKDLAACAELQSQRRSLLTKAYHVYKEAYESGAKTSYYTGINTATMALLLDRQDEAESVAEEVMALCLKARAEQKRGNTQDVVDEHAYWLNATLGEVSVIQGRMRNAMAYFQEATDSAPRAYGKYSSTLRQIKLLLEHRSATHTRDYNRRESVVTAMESQMAAFVDAVVLESRHTLRVRRLANASDSDGSTNASPRRTPTAVMRAPSINYVNGSHNDLLAAQPTELEVLQPKAELACARVAQALQSKKPLDQRWVNLITFEIGEATAFDTQGEFKSPFGSDSDVDEVVVEAAANVAVTKFGAGPLLPFTHSFSHSWFQRVFKLPSVVALLSAYTHEDVVGIPACEATLRRRFAAVLEKTNSGFAFGSPCTFGDIVFLEEVHRRGGEIWLVLPAPIDVHERFLRDRFRKVAHTVAHDEEGLLAHVSVGFDSVLVPNESPSHNVADAMLQRFRELVNVAAKVDISNAMTPEITSANMHYCGMVLYGLAAMKAKKLGVPLERVFLKVLPQKTVGTEAPVSPTSSGSLGSPHAPLQSTTSHGSGTHVARGSLRSPSLRSPSSLSDSAVTATAAPSGAVGGRRTFVPTSPSKRQVLTSSRYVHRKAGDKPPLASGLRVCTELDPRPPMSTRRSRTLSIQEDVEGTPRSMLKPQEVTAFGTPRKPNATFFDSAFTVGAPATSGADRLNATTEGMDEQLYPEPAASPRSSKSWYVTPTMVELWEERNLPFRVLFAPVQHVRSAQAVDPDTSPHVRRAPLVRAASGGVMLPDKKTPQVITAILFADIVGYSKLSELQVLSFVENFLGTVRDLIDASPLSARPVVKNTWGDAFYFVFTRLADAGEFALNFSKLVLTTDWTLFGLPSSLNIRISLHAAPVFVVTDPITGNRNYTGVHTSMAARIEPITPPGHVYCSQAYAAMTLALEPKNMDCTYVGNVPLAKSYGLQKVYRLHRTTLSV